MTISGRAVRTTRQHEVRQTLSNQGNHAASFLCSLMVPNRRRQWAESCFRLVQGANSFIACPTAASLSSISLWLRAEEIDGPRVLNCRLEVERYGGSGRNCFAGRNDMILYDW